jgi:hypothetical protein
MSSTTEHQKEVTPRNDSVSASKDVDSAHSNASDEETMPSPAKKTDDDKHMATALASLKLAAEKVAASGVVKDDAASSKSSDEEFFSDEEVEHSVGVDEKTDLKLADETANDASSASAKKNEEAATSKSHGEQVSHPVKADENTIPKLTAQTAPKPVSAKTNDEASASKVDTATYTAVPTDETATPRLSAYINLHNDVSSFSHSPTQPLSLHPLTLPLTR